jgi:hypothetical protein
MLFFIFMVCNNAVVLAGDVGIGVFLENSGFLKGDKIDFYLSGYNNSMTSELVDVHSRAIKRWHFL